MYTHSESLAYSRMMTFIYTPSLCILHFSKNLITDEITIQLQWYPRDSLSAPISSAIYSCDGLLIFTGFGDGAVGIFDAESLVLRCRIAPSAYISASISRYAN